MMVQKLSGPPEGLAVLLLAVDSWGAEELHDLTRLM